MALWTLTPVEIASRCADSSASGRSTRITRAGAGPGRFGSPAGYLVIDVEPVKSLAARLLVFHPLQCLDALQLGAALHGVELGPPQERTLLTLDGRLALSAEREGFVVPFACPRGCLSLTTMLSASACLPAFPLALAIGLPKARPRAGRALAGPLDGPGLRRPFAAETRWGVAALVWVATGLVRAFAGLERWVRVSTWPRFSFLA